MTKDMSKEEIRKKYAELLQKISSDERDEFLQFGGSHNKVNEYLDEAHALLAQVKEAPEFALDAKLFAQLVRTLREKAESLDTNVNKFDVMEFAELLAQEISGSVDDSQNEIERFTEEQFLDFSHKVVYLINRPVGLRCMIGAFDLEVAQPPPKKERAKREKLVQAKEKRPEKVSVDVHSDPTTEEHVNHVYRSLKKATRPVNYFKFLLDPTSFGKSVENVFHFSFLVRDTLASVDLNENRLPVVDIVHRDVQEAIRTGQTPSEPKQFIMSMDMHDWEELVSVFLPGNPPPRAMIPPINMEEVVEKRRRKK